MPEYSYTNDVAGATILKFFPMGKQPEKVKAHGLVWRRDIAADHRKSLSAEHYQGNLWKGKENCMSGVPAKQLPALLSKLKNDGIKDVPDFKPDRHGMMQPVYTSRGQRNQYIKARGLRDMDAGYGDYAGEGS